MDPLRTCKRFGENRDGSITIMSVFMTIVLIGMAALAIDVGEFYVAKRKQQTATDIAAIVAAGDLAHAQSAAAANLVANGFASSALVSVELGTYKADPTIAPGQRFVAGTSGTPNAVRVTVRTTVPFVFGGIFGSANAAAPNGTTAGATIKTQAVAAATNVAAFTVGSRLAQLNGGILNAILGGLLGTQVNLSVMDYQALASAKVDLFAFSNALATKINLQAATYNDLAASNVRMGDVLGALAATPTTSGGSSGASSALSNIASAAGLGTTRFPEGTLISYGPYGSYAIGASGPLKANLSALDLLFAAAQIANGQHEVQAALGVNLPGVASASLKLTIGEPPVGSSFAAVGSEGTTVHTAQTRVLLTIQLLGSGSISVVNLPLYVEVATATGRLASIACPAGDVTQSQVQLGITPGIVDAWIGAVSDSDFTNLSAPPSPPPATLVNLPGLATVTGRAHVTMTNMNETLVAFSYADIAAGTVKTVSTTDFTSSLVSQLLGTLQLNVNVLGLGLGVPAGLDKSVANILAADLQPIDQVLASTLLALGITLGDADSLVNGVRCGQGALVN